MGGPHCLLPLSCTVASPQMTEPETWQPLPSIHPVPTVCFLPLPSVPRAALVWDAAPVPPHTPYL